MPLIEDVPPQGIVTFPEGLPGLDGNCRFALLRPDGLDPFILLQSLDDEAVSLPTIPPHAIVGSYQIDLTPEDRELLGLDETAATNSLVSLAVVILPGQGQKAHCNLFAPIVINPATNTGKQVLQATSAYSTLHPLEDA